MTTEAEAAEAVRAQHAVLTGMDAYERVIALACACIESKPARFDRLKPWPWSPRSWAST